MIDALAVWSVSVAIADLVAPREPRSDRRRAILAVVALPITVGLAGSALGLTRPGSPWWGSP